MIPAHRTAFVSFLCVMGACVGCSRSSSAGDSSNRDAAIELFYLLLDQLSHDGRNNLAAATQQVSRTPTPTSQADRIAHFLICEDEKSWNNRGQHANDIAVLPILIDGTADYGLTFDVRWRKISAAERAQLEQHSFRIVFPRIAEIDSHSGR